MAKKEKGCGEKKEFQNTLSALEKNMNRFLSHSGKCQNHMKVCVCLCIPGKGWHRDTEKAKKATYVRTLAVALRGEGERDD